MTGRDDDDAPRPAAPQGALEQALDGIEAGLGSLQQAVLAGDMQAIDAEATALHRGLARAVDVFMRAGRDGPVPPALRRRLAMASARVAAQRETLARASVALDQALDMLIPDPAGPGGPYTPQRAKGARLSRGVAIGG